MDPHPFTSSHSQLGAFGRQKSVVLHINRKKPQDQKRQLIEQKIKDLTEGQGPVVLDLSDTGIN